MRINGTVRFPPGPPIDVKAVHITVRDITDFDGPAHIVASVDLPSLEVPPDGLDLPFDLEADAGDARRMYSVRVHADLSGSGAVEPGDLVTMTAHVVDPKQRDEAVLELQPVTG